MPLLSGGSTKFLRHHRCGEGLQFYTLCSPGLSLGDLTVIGGLPFVHRFEPATEKGKPPVLLLHGTGGDENDLIELGRLVAPGSALLSPRGKVSERGMARYFRRLAEGVFDEEDVRFRANELADFIDEARQAYMLGPLTALGFSNGANIAGAMLFLRPESLAGGALIRSMVPLARPPAADLRGKKILILSGAADPIVSPDNVGQLAELLSAAGADVSHQSVPAGHGLSQADVHAAKMWFESLPAI